MAKTLDPDIDLLHALEIFVVVAEQGSMTAAGSVLGMTQSAISQQMHNLELSIGTALIDRELRPLRLTVAGSMLFDRAKQLLLDATTLRMSMRTALAIPIPHLRLGMLGSIGGSLAAPLVFELLDTRAAKSIAVRTGFGDDHQRALQNREVDLIVIVDPLYELGGLERHELFTEPFVLVVPAGFRAGAVTYAGLLESLPLIRHSIRSPIGLFIEQHLRRVRIAAPLHVEFDSIDAIVAAVSLGRGWAITTPTLLLQALRSQSAVSVRPMPAPGLNRSFALIARGGELGDLPAGVARLARRIVRETVVPRIAEFAPFAGRLFEFPTPLDERRVDR